MGTSLPRKAGGTALPTFGPCIVAKRLHGSICHFDMGVGLDQGHIVLHADPAPQKKAYSSPQFSAHVCCGQMAGWIKMPLRVEVGLGPGHIVLDGDPPPKGHSLSAPIFGP